MTVPTITRTIPTDQRRLAKARRDGASRDGFPGAERLFGRNGLTQTTLLTTLD